MNPFEGISTPEQYAFYTLEHATLPDKFLSMGRSWLDKFMAAPDPRCEFYTLLRGYPIFFRDAAYHVSVETLYAEGDRLIVRADFPNTAACPLCRWVYFCLQGDARHYFTSERMETGDFCLCAWREDRTHVNFGCIGSAEDELAYISKGFR